MIWLAIAVMQAVADPQCCVLEVDEEGVVAGGFGDLNKFAIGDQFDNEGDTDLVFGCLGCQVVLGN